MLLNAYAFNFINTVISFWPESRNETSKIAHFFVISHKCNVIIAIVMLEAEREFLKGISSFRPQSGCNYAFFFMSLN